MYALSLLTIAQVSRRPVSRQAPDMVSTWTPARSRGCPRGGQVAQPDDAAADGRPSRRRLVVRVVLAVAVVAAIYFGLLPRLVDVSQVGRRCGR